MMYTMYEYTDPQKMMLAGSKDPFGPQFDPATVERAAKMVVRGTSFTDDGPDFTEFELLDADGNSIGIRRCGGY